MAYTQKDLRAINQQQNIYQPQGQYGTADQAVPPGLNVDHQQRTVTDYSFYNTEIYIPGKQIKERALDPQKLYLYYTPIFVDSTGGTVTQIAINPTEDEGFNLSAGDRRNQLASFTLLTRLNDDNGSVSYGFTEISDAIIRDAYNNLNPSMENIVDWDNGTRTVSSGNINYQIGIFNSLDNPNLQFENVLSTSTIDALNAILFVTQTSEEPFEIMNNYLSCEGQTECPWFSENIDLQLGGLTKYFNAKELLSVEIDYIHLQKEASMNDELQSLLTASGNIKTMVKSSLEVIKDSPQWRYSDDFAIGGSGAKWDVNKDPHFNFQQDLTETLDGKAKYRVEAGFYGKSIPETEGIQVKPLIRSFWVCLATNRL